MHADTDTVAPREPLRRWELTRKLYAAHHKRYGKPIGESLDGWKYLVASRARCRKGSEARRR